MASTPSTDSALPPKTIAFETTGLAVAYPDVEAASRRLADVAHCTPVLTSTTINQLTHGQIFFKCENFQRTGSFKFRGAYNALVQLSQQQKQQGVLTYSSGNHAQAIALAGKLLGIRSIIVMPDDAPAVKQAATRDYGAEIILHNRSETAREELGKKIAGDRGLTVVPPYDHPHIIAGQGTAAMELIQEVGPLDFLLVPCGGGELLSGSAIAAKTLLPGCQVIGIEPQQANDATQSFHTKVLHTVHNPDTIADGARTPSLGQITFPLVLHFVDDMRTVSEAAIVRTMFFLWERMKTVVEPTGALAAAALLEEVITAQGARVGVILSGGNVALQQISPLLSESDSWGKS